ncbi:hypothetical protein C7293_31015, partial [filamentous cyanobacterium CCT1]
GFQGFHQGMKYIGVTGSTADVLHALVETLEAKVEQAERQETKTVSEVAQAINWFTQEIESLRQQIRDLEQAHLPATPAPPANTEELTALQECNAQLEARNAELKADLEATRSQLSAIQELLGGGPRTAPASKPTPTKPQEPTQSVITQAEPKQDRPPSRPDTTDKIADVIDAIIKWNTAQERSDLRLRISFPSVRSLAVLVGASYLPAIKDVMEAKQSEIDEIHERYLIGSRHNRSVQDKDGVLKAIARDYLGIPNWNEAVYVN